MSISPASYYHNNCISYKLNVDDDPTTTVTDTDMGESNGMLIKLNNNNYSI